MWRAIQLFYFEAGKGWFACEKKRVRGEPEWKSIKVQLENNLVSSIDLIGSINGSLIERDMAVREKFEQYFW